MRKVEEGRLDEVIAWVLVAPDAEAELPRVDGLRLFNRATLPLLHLTDSLPVECLPFLDAFGHRLCRYDPLLVRMWSAT